MTAQTVRMSESWLALREPADAAARSPQLVDRLRRHLGGRRHVIHDLGCGSGSMGRWLAPLLPGPQHWVLHDRDPDLLEAAASHPPGRAADGAAVTVETKCSDIGALGAEELAGASLITASALLDMLTADELTALVAVCARTGCPVLLALSVVGRVELSPEHPLDARITAAFNAHQQRDTARGPLLGPEAVPFTVQAFHDRNAEILVRDSPWRLGARHAELTAQWLRDWLAAACEQDESLVASTGDYSRRRLAQLADGRLAVTLHHADLLALPR